MTRRSVPLGASCGGLVVALICGTFLSGAAVGQKSGSHPDMLIPDRAVINAEGKQLSFEHDVLELGPVLVGFIFTRCERNCPRLQNAWMLLPMT
jgi:hypothetical protein